MKKLGLALLVATVTAAPVSAGAPGWNWSWLGACGGDNFTTCMSGSISYNGSGVISVNVTNVTPYAGDIFTAVGLFNLPVGALPASYTDGALTWSPNNGINGGGLPGGNDRRYSIGSNGVGGGFSEAMGPQTFTFTFAQDDWGALAGARNTIGVGIHSQSGPNGCSAKVGVQSGGVIDNFDPEEATEQNCVSVSVPEPESYALLATGIAGLLFVAARRRKDLELVDENGNNVAA